MFMVTAMFAGPEEHRVLKGRRTKYQREKPYDPVGLEAPMREKPVIPDGDREAAGKKHYQKEDDLEGIQTEKPEISGHCGHCQKQSADQK
jgi:hypothetical protein